MAAGGTVGTTSAARIFYMPMTVKPIALKSRHGNAVIDARWLIVIGIMHHR